jgi:O-antigen chain-terminating methyltransferase
VATESDVKAQELAAILHEIRDRVRARYPEGEARGLGVALPDLLPVLHARDAAQSKVAAIGTVNPRPPGLANNIVQFVKQSIARSLNWFVRDQVEFNRASLVALETTLEALNEVNRTFVAVGARIDELGALRAEAVELRDMRAHWIRWREEWERKLLQNEVHFLKSVSELQTSFDGKLMHADVNYRETVRAQHIEFSASISKAVEDVKQGFWQDLASIRLEFERLIHAELRVIRQKAYSSAAPVAGQAPAASSGPVDFDYARFADRFRGTEDYVRERQQFYVPFFTGRGRVLDIGCGRGEFLEAMRQAGVRAIGVDLDNESVDLCRSKGLEAEHADAFEWLADQPDYSLDGIFASQLVEHLQPDRVPQLVKLCSAKLKSGGVLSLETPNPECLAIFATHFYLDPTHTRPIPHGLLAFYMEEYGFGGIEVHRLSPAVESMPSLAELPAAFREAFFGGLDYGIIGKRL